MAVRGLRPLAAVANSPDGILDKPYEVESWWHCVAAAKSGGVQLLEDNMQKLALAAGLSVAASSAFAGNVVEPVMTPKQVVVVTASSSGAGLRVPLLAAATLN